MRIFQFGLILGFEFTLIIFSLITKQTWELDERMLCIRWNPIPIKPSAIR